MSAKGGALLFDITGVSTDGSRDKYYWEQVGTLRGEDNPVYEEMICMKVFCKFAVELKICKKMIQRSITQAVKEAYKFFPVVTITGPRQSGKTTLVKEVFNGMHGERTVTWILSEANILR